MAATETLTESTIADSLGQAVGDLDRLTGFLRGVEDAEVLDDYSQASTLLDESASLRAVMLQALGRLAINGRVNRDFLPVTRPIGKTRNTKALNLEAADSKQDQEPPTACELAELHAALQRIESLCVQYEDVCPDIGVVQEGVQFIKWTLTEAALPAIVTDAENPSRVPFRARFYVGQRICCEVEEGSCDDATVIEVGRLAMRVRIHQSKYRDSVEAIVGYDKWIELKDYRSLTRSKSSKSEDVAPAKPPQDPTPWPKRFHVGQEVNASATNGDFVEGTITDIGSLGIRVEPEGSDQSHPHPFMCPFDQMIITRKKHQRADADGQASHDTKEGTPWPERFHVGQIVDATNSDGETARGKIVDIDRLGIRVEPEDGGDSFVCPYEQPIAVWKE